MRTGLLRRARTHLLWQDPLLALAGNQSLIYAWVACYSVTVAPPPVHLPAEPQGQCPHVFSDRMGHRNQ